MKSVSFHEMAARLIPVEAIRPLSRPSLPPLLALPALLVLGLISAPAHAASDRSTAHAPSQSLPAAASATLVSRTYPAPPARQTYPSPASAQPQLQPQSQPQYGYQPAAIPLALDPLAVCPTTMQTFITNSTNRAVPLWVAARSCDCYAQERADGNTQDQSSRRCFP
mgnify:CR=1 FL=1